MRSFKIQPSAEHKAPPEPLYILLSDTDLPLDKPPTLLADEDLPAEPMEEEIVHEALCGRATPVPLMPTLRTALPESPLTPVPGEEPSSDGVWTSPSILLDAPTAATRQNLDVLLGSWQPEERRIIKVRLGIHLVWYSG